MGGVTSALPHLSEFEVSIRLRQTAGREQRRWFVIWNALVDPRPASEIAIHTDVSVSTVHGVISRYNRFGPKAIESCDNGIRRRCCLSKDGEAEFLRPFFELAATGEICVAGQIKKSPEDLLDHKVHHSAVYRMLHRNQWREVVPRPVHPQAKGVRPKVPHQIAGTFLYVYAAVCMVLGKMTSLILPYANTDMMNLFLEEVSRDFKEYFVIMLVDGAGWHRSHGLEVPESIRLIRQPLHSPELNPAEHLWEDLRENHLPNKAFKSLDGAEQALCKGLRDLHSNASKVRSMMNFPYLQVTC